MNVKMYRIRHALVFQHVQGALGPIQQSLVVDHKADPALTGHGQLTFQPLHRLETAQGCEQAQQAAVADHQQGHRLVILADGGSDLGMGHRLQAMNLGELLLRQAQGMIMIPPKAKIEDRIGNVVQRKVWGLFQDALNARVEVRKDRVVLCQLRLRQQHHKGVAHLGHAKEGLLLQTPHEQMMEHPHHQQQQPSV